MVLEVRSSGGETVMILGSNSGLDFLLSTETFSDVRTYGIREVVIKKRRTGLTRELILTQELSTGISNV